MKKCILLFASVLTAGALCAQANPFDPPSAGEWKSKPQSAVNDVSGRFYLDEDNYLDVTDWQKVEFENFTFS